MIVAIKLLLPSIVFANENEPRLVNPFYFNVKHTMTKNVQIRKLSEGPFNLSMSSFRVKAFKLPVNKDTSKVQQNRGENNISTYKPFTLGQK